MYICATMCHNVAQNMAQNMAHFYKMLSISNVPASTKQATFPLYSVALMMKKMMNLINFLQQSKQRYMK